VIRDIVALIDGAPENAGVGECALSVAREFAAHLTLLGAPRDPGVMLHLAQAPAKALAAAVHRAHGAAEARCAELEERARAASIRCIRQIIEAPPLDYPVLVERAARRFDLCVIAIPGAESHLEDMQLFEAALFRSGRPALATPRGYKGAARFSRVMVAWDGGREAARALADAMPFLRRASLVQVTTVANGAEAEDPAQFDLRGHLALHDVACEIVRVPARGRKAEALLAHAREMGADLVVIGASRHSRWRQAVLGDTMREVTQETPAPLLLSG
jgi:nucleotide-binding universal stress UspA family protein